MLQSGYQYILRLNLKHYREMAGISQQEFANRVGMSFWHYQELERGAGNPTLDTLQKLAMLYSLTIDRLLRLDFLRLNIPFSKFISNMKSEYSTVKYTVGVRDFEGNIYHTNWADPIPVQKTISNEGSVGNVFALLDEPASNILKIQIACEKKLFPSPYTIAVNNTENKVSKYHRAYPTLLFEGKARQPTYSVIYISLTEQDCNKNYLDFATRLLKCAESYDLGS